MEISSYIRKNLKNYLLKNHKEILNIIFLSSENFEAESFSNVCRKLLEELDQNRLQEFFEKFKTMTNYLANFRIFESQKMDSQNLRTSQLESLGDCTLVNFVKNKIANKQRKVKLLFL